MITIICLLFVLVITFYKSITKAITTYVKELEYLNDPNSGLQLIIIDGIGEYFNIVDKEQPINIGEQINYKYENNNEYPDIESVVIDNIECIITIDNNNENRENNENNIVFKGDKPAQKYFDTGLMFINIGVVSVFSFTRSYFNICNFYYWIHSCGQFIVVGGLGYYTINYIITDYQNKREIQFNFIDGDIVWTSMIVKKFILIGTLTGFISTYIGIGGGMLTTPIMINSGMIPEVVVGTSSISTLCSCIISCLNYLAAGELPIIFGSVFATSSAIGSVGGIYISDYILNKYKRQSPIIFFVGLIIFLSIILLSVNAVNSKLITDSTSKYICDV